MRNHSTVLAPVRSSTSAKATIPGTALAVAQDRMWPEYGTELETLERLAQLRYINRKNALDPVPQPRRRGSLSPGQKLGFSSMAFFKAQGVRV